QGFQLLSFLCILSALQINTSSPAELALVFFVSSVISALPFSIGGIGTRELTMATGAAYFHFSATKMVTASLLLFLLIVISSLAGWAISSDRTKN
ncbi:MAG: lysylphosphatidylglycerol synthase domain-containing protein, partial [Chitinophagaceae bacterium]